MDVLTQKNGPYWGIFRYTRTLIAEMFWGKMVLK